MIPKKPERGDYTEDRWESGYNQACDDFEPYCQYLEDKLKKVDAIQECGCLKCGRYQNEQCFCQSYYDDNILKNCTCGKCK